MKRKPTYCCLVCGWSGTEPSISDTSENVKVDKLEVVVSTIHVTVCPVCFKDVSIQTKPDFYLTDRGAHYELTAGTSAGKSLLAQQQELRNTRIDHDNWVEFALKLNHAGYTVVLQGYKR